MFKQVSYCFIPGLLLLLVVSILNLFSYSRQKRIQKKLEQCTSSRLRETTLFLYNFLSIKLQSLEQQFYSRIMRERKCEAAMIQKKINLMVFNISSLWITPLIIINLTFAFYLYQGNSLTILQVFTTISVFSLLQFPIR